MLYAERGRIENLIRDLFRPAMKKLIWALELKRWKAGTLPVPHIIKQKSIVKYAKANQIGVLIETGTCVGDMAWAMRNIFNYIYTIELSENLVWEARRRLGKYGNITIIEGDSTCKLRDLANAIREPCIFWLDSHYSGGVTVGSNDNIPIIHELDIILARNNNHDIILVDDVCDLERAGIDVNDLMLLAERSQCAWKSKVLNNMIIMNCCHEI